MTKKIMLGFVAALAVAACGEKKEKEADGKKDGPPPGAARLSIAPEFERVADKMCACKDAACAAAVQQDWTYVTTQYKDKAAGDEKQLARIRIASEKLADCQTKLAAAAPAPAPPPAVDAGTPP